jgi:undecaprenyl phosphate N,N'-diacetylbacillosamine 1-phosphate transferase
MERKLNLFFKRAVDIILSGILIIIFSPIMLIAIILIKITMPGPVFFKQERVGMNKKTFYVLKFRTMTVDKKAEANFDMSRDSQRLTPLGKILRRTKIDELPQLINVLLGDMSLAGPRPTIMNQVKEYDDFQMTRLKMRPGMTGLAQVNGNTSLSWEERIKYDVYYVQNYSIVLDFKILIKTIAVVILGENKFRKEIN